MKKLITLIMLVILLISLSFIVNDKEEATFNQEDEIRAIYISYIELSKYLDNKDGVEIKEEIKKMIENVKSDNFTWIMLHTRSFSDSIFPSIIYPSSYLITREEEEIEFDILEEFINQAHESNIEIHAWINPYRIRNDTDIDSISVKNPAFKWLTTQHVKIVKDEGIYYNPASSEVIKLIVNGIGEIIEKYDVDGIHFDDYFYPSIEEEFDSYFYQEYLKNNGTDSLEQFRLNNVNTLIKEVYKKIKSTDQNIKFTIAPDANIENNYELNYADVKTWLKEADYVDYIMPQIYYGFQNETKPFIKTINEWDNYIKNDKIKLIPALALYKTGTIDEYAKSGKNEWLEHNNIIAREVQIARKMKHYNGFAIFRYDYLYNPENDITKNEIKNLREILTN